MRQTRMALGTIAAFGALGFSLATFGSFGCGPSDENRTDTSTGNASGPATWVRRVGGDGAQVGFLIGANDAGGIVAVGTMEKTVDLGAAGKLQAKTDSDIFMTWLNKDGTITRARSFGETGYHIPVGLALDAQGGAILSGLSGGNINFGGGNLVNAGGTDAFIASIGPAGQTRFALRVGSTGNENGGEVAIDAAGNIIWSGTFEGTVDIGGTSLTSKGQSDVFVAKLDPTGKVLWAKSLGGTGIEGDSSLLIDKKGRILLGGYYAGAPDLGKGALPDTGQSDGEMLVALDGGTGNVVYSRGVPNTAGYFPFTLSLAEDGAVFLVGELAGSVDVFGKTITTAAQGVGVVRIDDTGAAQMTQVFAGDTPGHAIAVPKKGGGIILAGHFQGSMTFTDKMTSAGEDDIFFAWLTSEGQVTRTLRVGGAGRERIGDLTVLSTGEVVMIGAYDGTLDIGGGPATPTLGSADAFVAMFR